jgi:hypothetical protein
MCSRYYPGIEKKATGYGTSITGQTYQPSPKALPSTARKPVVKRSNSTPASNKPTTGAMKSVGPKPVGASKYPGANQVGGAKKAVTGSVGTAKSTIGGATGGANKALGGAPSSYNKPKSPYPTSATRSNSLPKPYGTTNTFPSSDKKTAVRPGQSKPFTPPTEQKKATDAGKKAYPGTSTIPGQGSRVPVQNQKPKYKPLPRLGAQVGQGQKMTHLAV